MEAGKADIWLLQEHKVVEPDAITRIRKKLGKQGTSSVFGPAAFTAKRGRSSGTAILLGQHWDVLEELKAPSGREHRATGARVWAGGMELQLWSIYGDDRDAVVTEQIVEEILQSSSSVLPLVLGGDFNVSPATVQKWLEPYPSVEVVSGGVPTCHVGEASSELDFFVASRSMLHLLGEGGVEVHKSAVATHYESVLRLRNR